jgi:hypothetical protein
VHVPDTQLLCHHLRARCGRGQPARHNRVTSLRRRGDRVELRGTNFTDILDVPCLGIPFANVDEANHAPNENRAILRGASGWLRPAPGECPRRGAQNL